MSKDVKQRGFNFVGSTIVYAWMQAIGIVNDHEVGCFRRDTADAAIQAGIQQGFWRRSFGHRVSSRTNEGADSGIAIPAVEWPRWSTLQSKFGAQCRRGRGAGPCPRYTGKR